MPETTSAAPLEEKREEEENRAREIETVAFVLDYDREIAYLLNDGVIRPEMVPRGFREA